MKIHPLIRSLLNLSPEADFAITSSREWHSLTFAGQRLTIDCRFQNALSCNHLETILPNHEFSIPGMLVADIAIVDQPNCSDSKQCTIEALIINE